MLDLLVESRRLDGVGDARLVVAIARRQTDALAEAYRRHAGAILGLARRVLGDHRLADEVVQEVFLGLWRAPDGFDPDRGSLRSYLLTQTHGKSVDTVRAEVSRRGREEREARLRAESGYDLEREVLDLTMADRVRRTMEALPEQERRAIELAYFGGQTYREVAVTLGEPEGTIKTRIRTGLKRMRSSLQEAGVDEP
ncbi:MAG: sigma-70 family RNA polymerase sigma factor [Actinomycetota bacterium]